MNINFNEQKHVFVKVRRGLLEHIQKKWLQGNEFPVLFALIMAAPIESGEVEFQSKDLAVVLNLKKHQVQHAMRRLFEKGYLVKLKGGGWRMEEYLVRIANFEITAGPKAGTRTPYSRVPGSESEAFRAQKSCSDGAGDVQHPFPHPCPQVCSNFDNAECTVTDSYQDAYATSSENFDESLTTGLPETLTTSSTEFDEDVKVYLLEEPRTQEGIGIGTRASVQHQAAPGTIPCPEPTNPRKKRNPPPPGAYQPAAQAQYLPPAAEETPAAPVSETSEIVNLLMAEFERHMPNHRTMITPKLYANQPEKLEPLASEPKATAVLHWIFNSADAFFWRDALIKANWPTSLFVSSWETILKQFEEKTSGTKQKPAKASAPSVVPSGPRVEERVPFGNPLTLDEIDKILAE